MPLFRSFLAASVGLIALMAFSGTGNAAITEDNFVSRTTGDLVALCSAEPSDKLYTAAVNFCHGFGAGAYGVLAAAQKADPDIRLFCPPPNITRNEAVAAFVSWASGKPERASLPAIDGVTAFLTESYPCPKATRRTR